MSARPVSHCEQRQIQLACGAALASLLPVLAHQAGLLRHLPDPPCRWFDSDRITGSAMAHPLGVPDALLGLGSYGATMALILASRRSRDAERLLALKLFADGGMAAFNSVRQVVKFRRVCSWCLGTALATAAMVYAGRKVIRSICSD